MCLPRWSFGLKAEGGARDERRDQVPGVKARAGGARGDGIEQTLVVAGGDAAERVPQDRARHTTGQARIVADQSRQRPGPVERLAVPLPAHIDRSSLVVLLSPGPDGIVFFETEPDRVEGLVAV